MQNAVSRIGYLLAFHWNSQFSNTVQILACTVQVSDLAFFEFQTN